MDEVWVYPGMTIEGVCELSISNQKHLQYTY